MSITRSITRHITRPLTRPLTAAGVGGVTAAEAFAASLAFIGDSLIYDSEYNWKNVSFSDAKGLPLSAGFCTGQGITADSLGGGLLEYRASDAHLRWTAPGDTAGPWTALFAGWNILESGTAGKGVRIGVQKATNLPASDQSIAVNVAGSPWNAWRACGFGARAMHYLRWLNASPKWLGLGGNATWEVIEQLPWLEEQASGVGFDIICLGTNDISASVSTATTTANFQTIFAARRALGRRLVIVGMPARWGANTSTPLTIEQQTTFQEVNDWLASWAAANGAVFVDAYALTYDPSFSDKRPKAGMLRDTVHYTDFGAQVVGKAVADAISALTGLGQQRGSDSDGNLLGTQGFMAGSGGTAGTGVTGTPATGWTVARVDGSDISATVSVYDRTDGVAGRWMEIVCSATSGEQIMQASNGNKTLASLGLSVGDTIYMETELDISAVSGGLVEVDTFVQFIGSSPLSRVKALRYSTTADRQGEEHSVRRSPTMVIPPGTTGLRYYLWVRTQDAAAATVKMASAAIVKVP